MRTRIDVGWLMALLFSSIGAPLACGGTSEESPGGGSGGQAPLVECTPSAGDPGGGFELCDEGFTHRPQSAACPAPTQSFLACDPSQSVDVTACAADGDCTARANGRCTQPGSYPGAVNDPCVCTYHCTTDADCEAGSICSCSSPTGGGVCVTATCSTDADCHGAFCASARIDCVGAAQFHCFTQADECTTDADCGVGNMCKYGTSARTCVPGGCGGIGRPFLVGGSERLACVVERSDWSATALRQELKDVDRELRPLLASAWTRVGLMEHASIAAFARFALELLALGAPAELLEQVHRAMADETRHARLCFALASSYAGATLGPSRLDVTDALGETSLESVVLTTLAEGCVGETMAAAEAAEAQRSATDPVIASVLSGIAADEARHAALAWRFVTWAVDTAPAGSAALEAIAAALESLAGAPAERELGDDLPAELARHGFVVGAERKALRAAVMARVVAPCASALAKRARSRKDARWEAPAVATS